MYRYHLHREYVLLLEFCIHVFALLASVPRRHHLTLPGLVICVLARLWVGLPEVQPLVTYLDIRMIDCLAQHCWHHPDLDCWEFSRARSRILILLSHSGCDSDTEKIRLNDYQDLQQIISQDSLKVSFTLFLNLLISSWYYSRYSSLFPPEIKTLSNFDTIQILVVYLSFRTTLTFLYLWATVSSKLGTLAGWTYVMWLMREQPTSF